MPQAPHVVDNRGMLSPSVTPETAPERGRALRVVLADDDVLLREGLASLLDRSGFEVAGQAGNGPGLLALVRSARPDLAIIDIRMPPAHGHRGSAGGAGDPRRSCPDTAIIVLSAHVEVDEAMDLLAAGERIGYLLKSRVTDVPSSSRRSSGSPPAPRWSTRPWYRSSSGPADGVIRSMSCHRASARCSP